MRSLTKVKLSIICLSIVVALNLMMSPPVVFADSCGGEVAHCTPGKVSKGSDFQQPKHDRVIQDPNGEALPQSGSHGEDCKGAVCRHVERLGDDTNKINHLFISSHHHKRGDLSSTITVFTEVFDLPHNSPVVVVNNATQKSVDSSKTAHLRGEIQNIGQKPVTVRSITATFYDLTGTIGGSTTVPISPSVLEPGQSAPFDISFFDDKKTPFNPFTDTTKVKYQIDYMVQ